MIKQRHKLVVQVERTGRVVQCVDDYPHRSNFRCVLPTPVQGFHQERVPKASAAGGTGIPREERCSLRTNTSCSPARFSDGQTAACPLFDRDPNCPEPHTQYTRLDGRFQGRNLNGIKNRLGYLQGPILEDHAGQALEIQAMLRYGNEVRLRLKSLRIE